MAQLMDHVTYLSKEIGARPVGTEEEQRAALYITEQLQKESGFTASIEDFSSFSKPETGLAIMAGITVLATVISMFFPPAVIPACILAAISAAIYSIEEFDRPVISRLPLISRLMAQDASQNVVAKYQPTADAEGQGMRRGSARKIVLLAHYDTGSVTPGLVNGLESGRLPIALICVAAIIAAAFFLLIRIFIASSGGMGLLVLNVLSSIACLICLYPIAKAVLIRMAPYNEGATNNATGTAALIEIARRVSRGSVSEAELADVETDVVIHGEEAARAAGLIPEGVQLIYEVEEPAPLPVEEEVEEYDEEERLLSAKAAIAALTGSPIENKIYVTIEKKPEPVYEDEYLLPEEEASFQGDYQPDGMYQPYEESGWNSWQSTSADEWAAGVSPVAHDDYTGITVDGFENAPSWFVAAQQNARKAEGSQSSKEPVIKRSKYTEAITNAERGLAQREEEMRAAELAAREEARRARQEQLRMQLDAQNAAPVAAVPSPLPEAAVEPAPAYAPIYTESPSPVQTVDYSAQQEQNAAVPMTDTPVVSYTPVIPETPVVPSTSVASDVPAASDVSDTPISPVYPENIESAQDRPAASFDPGSTAAMAMPTPSAEIIAEALAEDEHVLDGVPSLNIESAPAPKAAVDASSLPSPIEEGQAPNRVSSLPSIDPANPYSKPANDGANSVLSGLPSIHQDASAKDEPVKKSRPSVADEPSRSGILRKLRTSIPSLSGLISPVPSTEKKDEENSKQYDVREKVDYNMEVPLDEPIAQRAPAERVPAAQGASSVEIPRSRSGNLLNRLRSEENLTDIPQQWLDVDNDFDPRAAGRERGGWESFREGGSADDERTEGAGAGNSRNEGNSARRNWQGGAYSRMQLGYVDTRSGEDAEADKPIVDNPIEIEESAPIAEEIEQIYHFRNPLFNAEIWFVAVGADGKNHDGAHAFIDEHRDELRGALLIEVESLGAGRLSVASEEGRVRKAVVSSRIKRYTREATAATGIAVNSVSLAGTDSIASTLQKAGFQAMHLFGEEDGRPALKGSADDVVENVDELALEEHVSYVYELLKR